MPSKAGKSAQAPRGRPQAAPQLPAQQHAITRFSPFGDHVAYVTQAIDRHRLQVFEVKAGSSSSSSHASHDARTRLVADYVIPNARCESVEWIMAGSAADGDASNLNGADQSSSSKRRKRRQSLQNGETETNGAAQPVQSEQEVLALGLSSGAIHLYSPTQGKVLRVLLDKSGSTSAAASSSIVSLSFGNGMLYACAADGHVSGWSTSSILGKEHGDASVAPTWRLSLDTEDNTPFQQVACLNDLLICAHHAIRIVSTSSSEIVARYPGHASTVSHLIPVAGTAAQRFASAAKDDRIVNIWQAPSGQKTMSRPLATLALEAPARSMSSFEDQSGRVILLIVTTQGRCSLYEVPHSLGLDQSSPSKPRKSAGVQTLQSISEVTVVSATAKAQENVQPILDAQVSTGTMLRVARLGKLLKMTFESTKLAKVDESYPAQIRIVRGTGSQQGIDGEDDTMGGTAAVQRYQAGDMSTSTSHRRGATSELTGPSGMISAPQGVDGLGDDQDDADVDVQALEEPTLGQRLRSMRVNGDGVAQEGEASDDEDEAGQKAALPTGSLSLGETLTQALHSNDTAMLSSCLAHSDPVVIRLSVTRLSGPLALRLLEHCVDRMGRGGKRSTGQLGSQRTRGILEWVRATLTAHTAYLMTLPSLVHRLSQLHTTLSARLAAHDRLLALNGRLELVLSQIELRAAYAAEHSVNVHGVKSKVASGGKSSSNRRRSNKNGEPNQNQQQGREWVEESDSEEDNDDENGMDVDLSGSELDDVVQGDEEGEIQDISLGNAVRRKPALESDDEEDDDVGKEASNDSAMEEDAEEESDESSLEGDDSEEIEDDEDEDDEDEDDYERGTGLIDDEAESTDDDGEDEESEEEE